MNRMVCCIANIQLEVSYDNLLTINLFDLKNYGNNTASASQFCVTLFNYKLPKKHIPEYEDNYSGFLTHKSIDSSKDDFIFCFREGKLLFGIQREQNSSYSAYIHSQYAISCKTAVQYAILLECSKNGLLGMHAVTVEYGGRVILFSAPSGIGKTTHTELWRKRLGARILNGDFAFLECLTDQVRFHGTPFSGSSPYAEKGVWNVDDIVFLKQAPENRIMRISKAAAVINAMENCFIPTWDEARTKMCLDLIGRMLKTTRVWQLECNMDPEAAYVARDAIFNDIG